MIDRNTMIRLKHILAMDIDGLGQPDAFLGGLHWDPNGMWEKSGVFKVLEKEVFPSEAYKLKIEWNNRIYTKNFFPQHWTMKEIFDETAQAYAVKILSKDPASPKEFQELGKD